MTAAIVALITAIAAAIPSIWGWKQYSDKKKLKREHEDKLNKIRHAVTSGDADTVRDELANWM